MICKKCGKEINDGIDMCPECGTNVNGMPNQPNLVQVSEKPKKKHKGLIIIGYIFALLLAVIIVIAIFGDDESDKIGSSDTKISSSSESEEFFKETFGDTEENVIKTLAISKIKENLEYDSEVYDVKILDKDSNYNYIVRGWTKSPDLIAKWWTVMIKLDTSTGKMTTYTKGEFTESDAWINKYKTESEYGWGKENHIE
ncbi:zinc ribbon domain-containing protein [Ruminococcus flavefaciens]|uniref:zinc ribbon domain-containing protein n=1 Tax=Ruminococcus flavefaciens TaxID=1265 RepID=UPI000464C7D4|nr:zinc ribbon domain-containing protein [Ruminococcus flavefaciens]